MWWANSTPLENGSVTRAGNFDLLLNSLGPRDGRHFYWDESLHGDVRSDWSYVSGPTVALLWTGLILISILIIFSFSRRSGPVREMPPPARATPIEFLEALGSLYRSAGAASTAADEADLDDVIPCRVDGGSEARERPHGRGGDRCLLQKLASRC